MKTSRTEWKVGLFIIICLTLLAGLLMNFAKGLTVFKPTYEIKLRTSNVGGIKAKAAVSMAGVPVGTVKKVDLTDDGKHVIIFLTILKRYQIHNDAIFSIEAMGFLGDQYVAVTPEKNEGPLLKAGDVVDCREPFNLQEAARSAMGLIHRLDQAVKQIHDSVARIDRTIFSETTLTNLTGTVENFRALSQQTRAAIDRAVILTDKAGVTLDKINGVVDNNTSPFRMAVTNLLQFTEQLNQVGAELQLTISTNRGQFTAAIKNVETATGQATNLLGKLENGKGLAGKLLADEKMEDQFSDLLGNLNVLSTNLVNLSSNLHRFGLLYKPKVVNTNYSSKRVYRGKPL